MGPVIGSPVGPVIDPDEPRPAIGHVLCAHPGGLHRMAYREWRPDGEERGTVVCVHGLTRNGGDFDPLAMVLSAEGWRVICPDIAGRGLSDWLPEAALYDVPQYVADCVTLLARLDRERVAWVGTSMGGLIGMALAAATASAGAAHPIERLLLNDVGPVLSREGLARIAGYVGKVARYPDFAAAEAALRETMASFGPHTDEQFRYLSRHYFVEDGGEWRAHYDPAIAVPFTEVPDGDMAMWELWAGIGCPVTVMRGAESDLLSAGTAEAMGRGGPDGGGIKAEVVTVDGVGHAPTLIDAGQARCVREALARR